MTSVGIPSTLDEADNALERGDETGETLQTPEGSAPAEPSPAPAESGPPRDAQGRFAKAEPAAPSPDTPDAPPADAAEPTPTPETPAVEAEAPDTPFTITADGQPFAIEGSAVGEDGVFIPTAALPKVERLLQQGIAWDGSAQRYMQQVNTRHQQLSQQYEGEKAARAAAETQLQHVLGHFEELIRASQGQDLNTSPIGQWILGVQTNWPVLQAEARAKAIELKAEADRKALQQYKEEQDKASRRPLMEQAIGHWVQTYGQKHGLDRATMEALYADLRSPEYEKVLFVTAPHDDPLSGISKGDTVIDHSIVEREVQRVLRYRPSAPAPAPQRPATPTVRPPTPQKKQTPPPTVSATRGPSPRKPLPVPTSREEADRLLEEGGYDLD